MTINELHKLTDYLIAQGKGGYAVCISKDTFGHVLEADGCTILDVEKAEIETHEMMDADGGAELRADGSVKTTTVLLLSGDWEPTP